MENNSIYKIKNKFVSCYEKGLSATINIKVKEENIVENNPSIEDLTLILSGEIYNEDILIYDNLMLISHDFPTQTNSYC